MKFEFFLARKLSRHKEGFVSIITKLAFTGVFLGVAALITVMSIMNGFKEELMRQLIGMKGHVIVVHPGGISKPEPIMQELQQQKNVTLTLPVIEEPTLMVYDGRYHGVMLYGHDPHSLSQHQYFTESMKKGTVQNLQKENTVLIGKGLAEEFDLHIGDSITLLNPEGEETLFGMTPKERQFEVGGIFELGMREYDRRFIFTSISSMQSFYNKPVGHIDVFTKTHDAKGIHLPYPYRVVEWKHSDSMLFKALMVQKNVMFIILSLMLLIAVLNIVSSMTMFVKDKTKVIAILRSMGMQRKNVLNVFLMSGCMIGVTGTALGTILGVFISRYVNNITQFIEKTFHVIIFNPELYFLSHLPSIIAYKDIALVCFVSLSFSLIATLYPAIRAARLDPAPVLR